MSLLLTSGLMTAEAATSRTVVTDAASYSIGDTITVTVTGAPTAATTAVGFYASGQDPTVDDPIGGLKYSDDTDVEPVSGAADFVIHFPTVGLSAGSGFVMKLIDAPLVPPSAPTLSGVPDRVETEGTGPWTFSLAPYASWTGTPTWTVTADPGGTGAFFASSSVGTLTIPNIGAAQGPVDVTIQIADAAGSASDTFALTVTAVTGQLIFSATPIATDATRDDFIARTGMSVKWGEVAGAADYAIEQIGGRWALKVIALQGTHGANCGLIFPGMPSTGVPGGPSKSISRVKIWWPVGYDFNPTDGVSGGGTKVAGPWGGGTPATSNQVGNDGFATTIWSGASFNYVGVGLDLNSPRGANDFATLAIADPQWRIDQNQGRWVQLEWENVIEASAGGFGTVRLWIDGVLEVDVAARYFDAGDWDPAAGVKGMYLRCWFGGAGVAQVDTPVYYTDLELYDTDSTLTLEPVDGAAEQIAIAADAGAMHSFEGFGLGMGSPGSGPQTIANLLNANPTYITKLFQDLKTNALNGYTGDASYKPLTDIGLANGVTKFIMHGFVVRNYMTHDRSGRCTLRRSTSPTSLMQA